MPKLLLLLLLLPACSSGIECGWGTHEEDGRCVAGALGEAFDEDACDPHPTVPAEYANLWHTDGCTTSDGKSGNAAYAVFSGRTSADGTLTGTEQWYWFFAEPGCYHDCIDTIEVTGQWANLDPGLYTCSECEETWSVTRELNDSVCGVAYSPFLTAYTETRSPEAPQALVLLDTHTPSGPRYEENKMLVVSVYEDQFQQFNPGNVNVDWALGHAFPDDPDETRVPLDGDYDWVAELCFGAW